MDAVKFIIGMTCTVSLLITSCATSPEVEARKLQKQASIAEILSQPLDAATAATIRPNSL